MIAYASRTGTVRNLAALRSAGWRILVSATGVWRTEGFPYAIDNGAWTSYKKKVPFDAGRFAGLVEKLGSGADFIVAPDIVCGGLDSLRLSESWLPRLGGLGRMLLVPVQDGMQPEDVRGLLGPEVGIFVGGGDPWKEHTLQTWGAVSREVGCYLHVGRVNSTRRIKRCALAGAHSFDGSGPSQFAVETPRLDRRRRSLLPFGGVPCEP